MGNTSKNGMVGETAVLNRLVQLEYEVLLPWRQDLGYDLAYYIETEERHFGFFIHKESQLVRVQCKSLCGKSSGLSLSQASKHDADHGQVDPGFFARWEHFIVLGEPTPGGKPGKGTFNDPGTLPLEVVFCL